MISTLPGLKVVDSEVVEDDGVEVDDVDPVVGGSVVCFPKLTNTLRPWRGCVGLCESVSSLVLLSLSMYFILRNS